MSKILELIGFALNGGTIYSFLGMGDSELRWPVFWSCAVGALAIYHLSKKEKEGTRNNNQFYRNFLKIKK